MAEPILIQGANLIGAPGHAGRVGDVLIERGRITRIGQRDAAPAGARTIDASGLICAPGFIDLHVHLREPGGERNETIETGGKAAVAGGFTRVFCMPNTNPVCDSKVVVKYIIDRAREAGAARVHPVASVTTGQAGERLCEFSALKDAGAGAFSDDGRPVANADVMRRAMQSIGDIGGVIFDHCEDLSLTGPGVMHGGVVSLRLGLHGIPRSSEATCAARDAMLAMETGARLHICHVSNRDTVEVIRFFKQRGAPVTAEVSPHHLTLTDEAVARLGTNAKMKPPLCDESDRAALISALEDGTIDCIATDHAPHSPESKAATMDAAPFGIIGLETAFSVLHTAFVVSGRWSMAFLVDKLTSSPARVMGQSWGLISAGSDADLVLIDPSMAWKFEAAGIASKSRNSPWLGETLRGRVVLTVVGGKVAFELARQPVSASSRGV